MSFVVEGSESKKLLHEITDAKILTERIPEWENRFDALQDMRDAYHDVGLITSFGRQLAGSNHWKRVASIPAPLLGQMLEIMPDLLLQKEKFYDWLDKHPEFGTYQRRRHK